jgi:ion channel-forming bestrophin family protein
MSLACSPSLCSYTCLIQFQVCAAYGYLTIPGTAFASFLLLGFLEIGQEMYVFVKLYIVKRPILRHSENPFNYDMNDLGQHVASVGKSSTNGPFSDLDHFCLALQRELHEITAVCLSSPDPSYSDIIIAYQCGSINICLQCMV